MRVTLITAYHFNASDTVAYARLLRSLSASVRELNSRGALILIANGTQVSEAGIRAEDPAKVIADLKAPGSASICVVELRANAGNVGGLNAGIARALVDSNDSDHWIGSVQSSAVLRPGWLDAVYNEGKRRSAQAVFGRLLMEDQPDRVWADGHHLCKGRTMCVHYMEPADSVGPPDKCAFPCLSAAIFHKDLIKCIVKKYGNLVCENLAHFGDCTDVAVRARAVDASAVFAYCAEAIALKRSPAKDSVRECCSQLLAAKLYYDNRDSEAEDRVFKKLPQIFVDIQREAGDRSRRPYSWTKAAAPPAPSSLDPIWGGERPAQLTGA